VRPLVLPANQPRRFYRGCARIAAFRGDPPDGEYVPEDWVGSTTALFCVDDPGLSRLDDGSLLREQIPYAAGEAVLTGEVRAIRCLPPTA